MLILDEARLARSPCRGEFRDPPIACRAAQVGRPRLECASRGDLVQPGSQGVSLAETKRAGPSGQDEEGGLEGILGGVAVLQDAPASLEHHRPVPLDQGFEVLLPPPLDRPRTGPAGGRPTDRSSFPRSRAAPRPSAPHSGSPVTSLWPAGNSTLSSQHERCPRRRPQYSFSEPIGIESVTDLSTLLGRFLRGLGHAAPAAQAWRREPGRECASARRGRRGPPSWPGAGAKNSLGAPPAARRSPSRT